MAQSNISHITKVWPCWRRGHRFSGHWQKYWTWRRQVRLFCRSLNGEIVIACRVEASALSNEYLVARASFTHLERPGSGVILSLAFDLKAVDCSAASGVVSPTCMQLGQRR